MSVSPVGRVAGVEARARRLAVTRAMARPTGDFRKN
jgi:hypothetical protein